MPEKVADLTRLHDSWLATMANPVKAGDKKWLPGVHEAAKKKKPTPEQKEKARSRVTREGNIRESLPE